MGTFHEDHEREIIRSTTELSLGPSPPAFPGTAAAESAAGSGYLEADGCRKKRKPSVELHLNDPCPLGWEQCLDLQSGKMYYIDRKTMKKSWRLPNDQNLNLELNISTSPSSVTSSGASASATHAATALVDRYENEYGNSSGDMVAVACRNCHLLVMLCKSSPSCPNCKFVHPPLPRRRRPESSETLSLLH